MLRIQPVGSQILSGVQIAGHSWNLWKGPNANWQVLSSLVRTARSGTSMRISKNSSVCLFILSFELIMGVEELRHLDYLVKNQGVASTQVSN